MASEPENKKENPEADEPKADQAGESGSGILKYIIMGGGVLLVVVLIVVGSMFLMGGDKQEAVDNTEDDTELTSVETESTPVEPPEFTEEFEPEQDSILFEDEDLSVIDNIAENLAFLEYQPDESELEIEETVMSVEDSVEQVNWLEQEKATLNQRNKELTEREKELAHLDRSVSKKLLTLEQVETTRINNLAKLYDGMASQSVAQLMANLDNTTIVALLPRMKTKNASAVLELMPPKRAAALSKQMLTIAEK